MSGLSARNLKYMRAFAEGHTDPEVVQQVVAQSNDTTLSTAAGATSLWRVAGAFFDIDTFDVLWFCSNCDDSGRISGWEGTFWDNSEITGFTS
jgi:hypothetical protein